MWVSPQLGLGKQRTIDAALLEPFEEPFEVTVGSKAKTEQTTLRNCRDYLASEGKIQYAGPATISNVLYLLGARCNALDLLRSARPAAHPVFRDFSFRQIEAKDLPPGLALLVGREDSERADRLTKRGESILAMDKRVQFHAKNANEAELSAPRLWTANLTILAHADFLGDGSEELLVQRNGAATGGTLRTSHIYLLARKESPGPLRIVRERPDKR